MVSDDDAPRPSERVLPRKLDPLSIEALHDYIADLEAEIERVRNEIMAKQSHQASAEALFRKSGD